MKTHAVLLAALLTAASASAADMVLDGVAAIVNSNVITYSEVEKYAQPVLQELQRKFSGDDLRDKARSARIDALQNLIDRSLILSEFHTKGYTIPDSILDQQINETIANEFGGDRTAFTKTLQAQKISLGQYRERIRERTIVQAMRGRKTQQEVVVSPHRIEEYYKQRLDDYKVKDQVKLRMIFLKKTGADDAARRAFAESLVAKLDAGAKFADLAKQHSEDADAKKGGERDWIVRDTIQQELNDAAFSLKPGQYSRVIETKHGYYILQVDDFKPAHTKTLAEMRDSIEALLIQEQRARMVENWTRELRAKAYIRTF
ncbi:MAG: parvulin peptidyl-prolyl isomerase [Verrucomicrobia bacterium]|nr:parvulin peptidyl-prolyl isomerase [Verrucomicrobiota bacterium]